MKIIFDAYGCGLANNGGSKTIIRSAEVLQELGHEVSIICKASTYSWSTIKVPHGPGTSHGSNAIVCVSVWDVDHALSQKCDNLVWWMRGWEEWVYGEAVLREKITEFWREGGRFVCNSNQLADRLGRHYYPEVCYPGVDIDFWLTEPDGNRSFDWGTMVNKRHKGKNLPRLDSFCEEFPDYSLVTNDARYNEYEMRRYYASLRKVVYYSENDGLPNVPIEAALCGCMVYINDNVKNGCREWANEDNVFYYKSPEHLAELLSLPYDKARVYRAQKAIVEKIGNRQDNMGKFVRLLNGN